MTEPDPPEWATNGRYEELQNSIGSRITAFIGTLCIPLVAGWLVYIAFQTAMTQWNQFPVLAKSMGFRTAVAISIAVIGFLFFKLREKRRRLYASIELGAACATGYFACSKLAENADRLTAIFGLMGAVYIAVRAFDNFDKAYEENLKKEKDKAQAALEGSPDNGSKTVAAPKHPLGTP